MQSERDYLRNYVFPRLEEELRRRRHHLEAIDLRQGVTAAEALPEESRELLVLKVCLDEIERSRPFLIVLLGDRYGWVPPPERMESAAREAGFSIDVKGRSVTALEIEFGILKKSAEQRRRCFFYFREPLPYEGIAPEIRGDYSEEFATDGAAAARRTALADLKRRLAADPELAPRVRTYRATWNAAAGRVAGLEAWGDLVFQDLWQELEHETREFAEKPDPTWEEIERSALAEFVEQRSRDFVGREGTLTELLEIAASPAAEGSQWGACVRGAAGAGKSALFARLVRELEGDASIVLLSNAAGATSRGSSVDAMLRRWCAELARRLGVESALADNASSKDVDDAFASLLARAAAGARVVVLIDAVDQFERTVRAGYLTWLPKPWPRNARLIATALAGSEAGALATSPHIRRIDLPLLAAADAHEIGRNIASRYHCPWDEGVFRTLSAKRLPDGNPAVGNPLWLTLAFEQLFLLDADDLARAEKQFTGSSDSRLSQLRVFMAGALPPDVPGLYKALLAQTEKVHGTALTRALAAAITISRHGWREEDLRAVIPRVSAILQPDEHPIEVTPLSLASLRRAFRAHLLMRGEQQWDFFHAQMRQAVAERCSIDPSLARRLHTAVADHLWNLGRDDPLRRDELMFHLIGADDYARAAALYGGALSGAETAAAASALSERLIAEVGLPGEWGDADVAPKESAPKKYWVISLLDAASGAGTIVNLAFNLLYEFFDRVHSYVPLAAARSIGRRLRGRLLELPAEARASDRWQFVMWSTYERLGYSEMEQGSVSTALDHFRSGLAFVMSLIEQTPANRRLHQLEGAAHAYMGMLLNMQGDTSGAIEANERAISAFQQADEFNGFGVDPITGRAVARLQLAALRRTQGDLESAVRTAEEGLRDIIPMVQADPSEIQWRTLVPSFYSELGQAREELGDLAGALAAHGEALGGFERLISLDPTKAAWLQGISTAYLYIGRLRRQQGNLTEALAALEAGLATAERLAARDPTNGLWQQLLSCFHPEIGQTREEMGNLPGALEAHERARALLERLTKLDPDKGQWLQGLCNAYFYVGRLQRQLGHSEDALSSLEAGLAVSERVIATNPLNSFARQQRGIICSEIGQLHEARGDFIQALEAHERSLAAFDELTRLDAMNTQWLVSLSMARYWVGHIRRLAGDSKGAAESLEIGLPVVEGLVDRDPTNGLWCQGLASLHSELGQVKEAMGDLPGAIESHRRGLSVFERLMGSNPGNMQWRQGLGTAHYWIGHLERRLGHMEQATESLREGLVVVEALAARDPAVPAWRKLLHSLVYELAQVRPAEGDAECLLAAQRAAVEACERMTSLDPSNTAWRDCEASIRMAIGQEREKQGDMAAALSEHERAVAAYEWLTALDRSNAGWRRGLWVACWWVASTREKMGDPSAMDWWRRALSLLSAMKQEGMSISPEDEKILESLPSKVSANGGSMRF